MKRYSILVRNMLGQHSEYCEVETNPAAIAIGMVKLGRADGSCVDIRDNETGLCVPWALPKTPRKKRDQLDERA